MALGSATIICEDQRVTDASARGQEDQGVCAETPQNSGEQDRCDFDSNLESGTRELECLCAASGVESTKTSATKQGSEPVEENLDRNVKFGRQGKGATMEAVGGAREIERATCKTSNDKDNTTDSNGNK